ncbi:MAG: hypothetical protein H6718_24265 [Polyangiaceae bacterium]|nr:hypothetical protein [Myxococcales bacterium]MCB9588546.1 hypothetical protein [Polyangiaceae bacterium]
MAPLEIRHLDVELNALGAAIQSAADRWRFGMARACHQADHLGHGVDRLTCCVSKHVAVLDAYT